MLVEIVDRLLESVLSATVNSHLVDFVDCSLQQSTPTLLHSGGLVNCLVQSILAETVNSHFTPYLAKPTDCSLQ